MDYETKLVQQSRKAPDSTRELVMKDIEPQEQPSEQEAI